MLSAKERAVLDELGQGVSYKELALRMGTSVSAIGSCASRAYRKLDARNVREALMRDKKRLDGTVLPVHALARL